VTALVAPALPNRLLAPGFWLPALSPSVFMDKIPITARSQQSTQTQVQVSLFLNDLLSIEIVDNPQPRLSAIFSTGEIKVEGLDLQHLFQIRERLLSLRPDAFDEVPPYNIHVSVRSVGGTDI
jgi:hypothetical protein